MVLLKTKSLFHCHLYLNHFRRVPTYVVVLTQLARKRIEGKSFSGFHSSVSHRRLPAPGSFMPAKVTAFTFSQEFPGLIRPVPSRCACGFLPVSHAESHWFDRAFTGTIPTKNFVHTEIGCWNFNQVAAARRQQMSSSAQQNPRNLSPNVYSDGLASLTSVSGNTDLSISLDSDS